MSVHQLTAEGPIDTQDLRSMLDSIRCIRHACDLDMLLFFRRHPCALLTSEQLAASLGYDRERAMESLDGLVDAGLLTRSRNASHAALLYILEQPVGLLSSLLEIAATREGRQGLMRLLGSTSRRSTSNRELQSASLTN